MRKSYTCIFCLILSISTTHLQAQNCWSPLGSGTSGLIEATTIFNGTLIVSGVFDSIGGIAANNIAAWNGVSWAPLGSGIERDTAHSINMDIASLIEYNGELYAAGQFDTAGGIPVNNIAKWNGTSWSAVGSGIPGTGYTVVSVIVYNGALYIGGLFDTAGGSPARDIAKWDGVQWSALDSGRVTVSGSVNCFAINNGILYLGGEFSTVGNIQANGIVAWNDTTWSALGSGIGNFNGGITALSFLNGNLYAAVLYLAFNYKDSLVEWNGNSWSTIAEISHDGFIFSTEALYTFDDNLIIGGRFDTIGGIAANNLAKWDGNTFSEFGGGISSSSTYPVLAFDTYNGYLYVAGNFTNIGSDSISAHSIAEYTCATDGIRGVAADHVHVYPIPRPVW